MTRYQTAVLTVIAVCLVYLCLVLTPWPRVIAQGPSSKGQPPTGPSSDPPTRVYVVGWYDADGQVHHLRAPSPGTALPVFNTNP